jgi:hypothetical protein
MDKPDVVIRDEGSVVLLEPQSDEGRNWLDENIGKDNGFQPYWPTVVCECRYVEDIVDGMIDSGLTIAA